MGWVGKGDFGTIRITPRREGGQTDCEFFHKLGENGDHSRQVRLRRVKGSRPGQDLPPRLPGRFSFREAAKR